MCKKTVLFLLTLMITTAWLTGCAVKKLSDDDMGDYEKIHSYYNHLKRYSADVTFTCYSNKTENTYHAVQKAMDFDKFFYTVTAKGSDTKITVVTNGSDIVTKMSESDTPITVPKAETVNLLFVNNFMKLYYGSEATALSVFGKAEQAVTVLETDLPKTDSGAEKAVLTIDNKTLSPRSLTLYDKDGHKLIYATYENFRYNDKAVTEHTFDIANIG